MNPLIMPLLIGLGVYYLVKQQTQTNTGGGGGGTTEPTSDQMRAALINAVNAGGDSDYTKRLATEAFNEMTNAELRTAWYWLFKQQRIEPDLTNLSYKYNLFT